MHVQSQRYATHLSTLYGRHKVEKQLQTLYYKMAFRYSVREACQ